MAHILSSGSVTDGTSPADWIAGSDLPWTRLVAVGPAGFQAYARLRFLPDPVRRGERESEVHPDWRSPDQAATLLAVLAGHTTTADDCFVALWEGLGDPPPVAEAPSWSCRTGPAEEPPAYG